MKRILFSILVLIATFNGNAQSDKKTNSIHKIVFQLTSDDTLVHKGLIKQLNNVLTATPTTKIEVVCHGPGISFLVTDKTTVYTNIMQMKAKGVTFEACENTLKEKNISKDRIIPEARFVPSAIVEIITKQEEGWSYIKAGF